MRWNDLFRMSISSLSRRKLRTFLTVLGVVIGTSSIVVMVSLGLGMQRSMYSEVEKNGGASGITVTGKRQEGMPGDGAKKERRTKYITDEVVKQLAQLEHVKSAEPVLSLPAVVLKGSYEGMIEIQGMTPAGLASMNLKMEKGGKLPDPDSRELQLVFGNYVLAGFTEKGTGRGYWETGVMPDIDLGKDPLFLVLDQDGYARSGQPADMGTEKQGGDGAGNAGISSAPAQAPKKYAVPVSGVVAGGEKNQNANSENVFCDLGVLKEYLRREFRGRAIPGQPTTKSGRPYGKFVYSSAKIQADDMKNVERISDEIRGMGYNVTTNKEYIDSMKKQFEMVQAVLGGIGAVSLLVAAIGIANTMMMSVYERTKEIGVMKVIGCSLSSIRRMFLIEAAFIGLAGGITGNILSLLISGVINIFVSGGGMELGGSISFIPVWLLFLSTGFAVLTGTAAGYFPARRAMGLSPLEAIRNG